MHTYLIKPGYSFRLPDGTVAGPGETIELADDVVAANARAVDRVPEAEPEAPAQSTQPPAAA